MLQNFLTLSGFFHMTVVVYVLVRVVTKRPATGVALAWLLLVAALPVLGIVLYFAFGERRVGGVRARRLAEIRTSYGDWLEKVLSHDITEVDWARHTPACERMNHLGVSLVGVPALVGNDLHVISDTQEILHSIIKDVDAATSTVHMMFYIWHPGGTADDVVDALVRAQQRGVRCRVLVDALGSKAWWRGRRRKKLRAAGVEVVRALPTGIVRALTSRNDLRLHRKIVVIDGEVAYTGSMNLVDPRFFKEGSGVGEWVDAMVRIQGPAVEPLLGTLLSDWRLETGEAIDHLIATSDLKALSREGSSDVQVIPSGPGDSRSDDAILQMILQMIYAAKDEVMITTPYFVPDDSMLRALRTAASRGARVTLILPAKVDSLLVRYASRSYFADLMEAGVTIQQFDGGLLHTKSITTDSCITMFGTVNLDMRSLWLNYEVSLFGYGDEFGQSIRALQISYLEHCTPIDPLEWSRRSARERFVENAASLVSPLL